MVASLIFGALRVELHSHAEAEQLVVGLLVAAAGSVQSQNCGELQNVAKAADGVQEWHIGDGVAQRGPQTLDDESLSEDADGTKQKDFGKYVEGSEDEVCEGLSECVDGTKQLVTVVRDVQTGQAGSEHQAIDRGVEGDK